MAEEITTQSPVFDGREQDITTGGYMARYAVARCQSVRDLLWTYGGIDPLSNRA
jgi:hypothetical protein